eukprot:9315202-Alexandrium_andersonii.AAC.1
MVPAADAVVELCAWSGPTLGLSTSADSKSAQSRTHAIFKRSEHELRGPRNGLNFPPCTGSSVEGGGVRRRFAR